MEELKSRLSSIVKRCGGGAITLRKLVTDYEKETGAKWPYKQFGFETPVALLDSLSDLLKVEGSRITLVNETGTEFQPHQDDGNWKSFKKTVPPDIQEHIERLARTYPNGICEVEFLSMVENHYGVQIDPKSYGFSNGYELLLCCPNIILGTYRKELVVYPKTDCQSSAISRRSPSPPRSKRCEDCQYSAISRRSPSPPIRVRHEDFQSSAISRRSPSPPRSKRREDCQESAISRRSPSPPICVRHEDFQSSAISRRSPSPPIRVRHEDFQSSAISRRSPSPPRSKRREDCQESAISRRSPSPPICVRHEDFQSSAISRRSPSPPRSKRREDRQSSTISRRSHRLPISVRHEDCQSSAISRRSPSPPRSTRREDCQSSTISRRSPSKPNSEPHEMPSFEQLAQLWDPWFDEDECDPGYNFLPPELPRQQWVTVEIVDALSPSEFWVHTMESKAKFSKLMKKLNDYYNKIPIPNYDEEWEPVRHQLPSWFLITVGLPVCAYYLEDWIRAVVKSVDGNTRKIEIFCIDYGTIAKVPRTCLRKLHRMFANDEMFAIKASLFNVRPPNGEWSMDSYSFIYDEWSYIKLSAKIVKVAPEVPQIELYLFSNKTATFKNNFTKWTNEANDVVYNVNEILVDCNHAVWIVAPDSEDLSRDIECAKIWQEEEPTEEQEPERTDEPDSDSSDSEEEPLEFSGRIPEEHWETVYQAIPMVERQEPRIIQHRPIPTTSLLSMSAKEHRKYEAPNGRLTHKVDPTTIRYAAIDFSIAKSTMKLNLIEQNGQFFVLKKSLFGLAFRVAPSKRELCYKQANLNSLEVRVNQSQYPELWKLLRKFHQIDDGDTGDCIMVPLQNAAIFCKTLDPQGSSDYDELFNQLLQRLQ